MCVCLPNYRAQIHLGEGITQLSRSWAAALAHRIRTLGPSMKTFSDREVKALRNLTQPPRGYQSQRLLSSVLY
jgi:hypothetical protein